MKKTCLTRILKFSLIKPIVFILLFFQSYFLSAQENKWCNIKGVINSNISAKPVDGAYLLVKKGANKEYIFLTGKEGEYWLSYPNFSTSDSVLITHIGFTSMFLSVNDLILNPNISLKEQIYEIGEVTVKNKKTKSYEVGNRKELSICSYGTGYNSLRALYVEKPDYCAKIIKAKIRFGKHHFGDIVSENCIPVRIRLLSVVLDKIFPNEDLISDTILVALAPEENWLEVDLSYLNIKIPSNGIFLGIEVLPFDFYFSRNILKKSVSDGSRWSNAPVISGSLPIKTGETQSFVFYNVSNDHFKNWRVAFENQKRDFLMKLIVTKVEEPK